MKLGLVIVAAVFFLGAVSVKASSLPPCWAYLQEHVAILEQGEPHLIGGYMPQCDEAGYFKLTQCSGSTGYCWCTTPAGIKIPETERRPGHLEGLDCKAENIKFGTKL